MVHGAVEQPDEVIPSRPIVAATMFGVTTPCVDQARRILEKSAVEVLVFHATGVGGQAMEGLVRDGQITGVLDLTTTEIADEIVGACSRPAPTGSKPRADRDSPGG